MAQPVVLLGAGRRDSCDEFPLARIAAVRPVVLVDPDPPAWTRPYLAGYLTADPAREAHTTEAVLAYAAGHPVAGVLTWSRAHLTTAARITARLGLPGLPYETAAACADPVALRTLLHRSRLPTTGPRDEGDTPDAGNTGQARDGEGPLVSAETVVLDDEVHIVALTRTTPGPPPARSPLRHHVHAHDGLLHNRFLRTCVERTARALALTHTVAHITLRLTARGPRVLAVAPHLPGDLIPLLVERATGVDLATAAAALATGDQPDLTPTRQRAAAVQFAYPTVTGRLTHLHLDPAAEHDPSADHMLLTRHPGDPVTAAPHADVTDRLARWVATGEDPTACEEALRRLARHLTVTVAPAPDVHAA
ncbi:hypothetical protein [Streptomyces cinerochromogenes]|uniref:hypothetical protein n=1 Tax=Streptomyces cinerochromogenes TaxID=66422 RepID=UPI001671462E|nr:hypothetical protein [Streptomyces cinerochromogenes]GGS43529.1 carboxylase [Streptomyces cinerochromogenes]